MYFLPQRLLIIGGGNDMSIIYKITNDINNKIYIGKTCNSLKYRW